MAEEIQTLDLRPMPPFERHEKIFQIWYQLEVEYKNHYAWEYEQSGPKDWIVRIKKI